ncbi:hypothetical protein [Laspinema olomoucense]|uniref:hypothetical protein n=1 Tax=Laspinema olomoucense TaxID=3231600 RepID=UPI0021BB69AB|nr:hypothetical protein [Laspinema sp. D3c]MCT7992496.1 hypothetical protein [Laspinema sp. D3c]
MIDKQWTGIEEDLIIKAGFESEFYPFSYSLPRFKIEKKWTGWKTLDYVGCRQARKHQDTISAPQEYYAFLVLRNDGLIAKGINQPRLKLPIQKPGTLIILKRHCYHHVIVDNRLGNNQDSKFWIALGQVFDVKPTRFEVFQLFQQFLIQRLSHKYSDI